MFKKVSVLIGLGVLMIGMLSGCKKGDETTLSRVKDKKEMSFAMTGAYPPFNFIDEEGELVGFDIDIASAIAKEMGVKSKPIIAEWGGLIGGLVGERFDMIIGSMAITEDRLKEVNFSDPYYYDGAQFFAKVGSGLTSIDDLVEGEVGVVTGTTFHDALKEMDNIKEILQFKSDVDNIMALGQDRSDGLVTGIFVGLQAKEKYGVDLEPVGDFIYSEEIGIAIRKEDTELLEAVNDALQVLIDNGTYEEISLKWFGINLLDKK